jgi:erythromycin esterase
MPPHRDTKQGFQLTRRGLLASGGAAAIGAYGWWAYRGLEQNAAEADVLEWMKSHIQRFKPQEPETLTASGAMVRALAGATVIGLGEATHGSHEDLVCKAEIVRALVQAGAIKTVFLEANSRGGRELDRFIAEGAGSAIERVQTADIFMILKTRVLADLLAWLREWNTQTISRIRIIGVDCQASAPDTAFAIEWLRSVDPKGADSFAERLAALLSEDARSKRFPDLIASLTTSQLNLAMTELELLAQALRPAGPYGGLEGREAAEQSARTAWQGLKAFELETADGVIEGDVAEYFSRRDRFMADNIMRHGETAAGVYWAHNVHVAGSKLGDDKASFIPTGYHLRERLGDGYRTVIFEFAEARFSAVPVWPWGDFPSATDPQIVIEWPYRAGRLAGLFRSLGGGDAWVDLSAMPRTTGLLEWEKRPYTFKSPGYAAAPWIDLFSETLTIRPRPMIDILIHLDQLTPSHLLPTA